MLVAIFQPFHVFKCGHQHLRLQRGFIQHILTLLIMFPLQFAVTIGLQYVNSSLSTLANPEDPESESEGWILEKTVKETFTDIMDKMKAVGKGGKVEEGGEAAVATVS